MSQQENADPSLAPRSVPAAAGTQGAGSKWTWPITIGIAVIILLTMYGITVHRMEARREAALPAATASLLS